MPARREIGKWLNERPNREVDRVALAELCAEYDEYVALGWKPERIVVGEYAITRNQDGNYWIAHKSGEGMQVFKLNFEKLIDEYYKSEF